MRLLPLLTTLSLILPLLSLTACSNKGGDGDEAANTGETGDPGPAPMGAPAANIGITKVSINQGVEIDLFADGSDITNLNARLVEGRPALLRVYVEPLMGWTFRTHQAVLTLEGGQGTTTYESVMEPPGLSTEGNLDSTFNFEIPAADLQGDQSISIALFEVDGATFEGDTSRSMWPSQGSYTADFVTVGPMRITLVPIQYDADGSGRLPDVSEAQVQRYRDLFMGMYPLSEVQVTVADPFPWGGTIGATGQGWQQMLMAMMSLRDALGLGGDEYIYGLMAPADSFQAFCQVGCVAGLSALSDNPGDSFARSSIGIGFSGDDAALTMAHEVGHAHGRQHAPCMLLGQPSDPSYPYSGAELGVWGWDHVNAALKGPTSYTDIMGYCMPNWVSDYTYDAMLERSLAVNTAALQPPPVGEQLELSATWFDENGQIADELELLTLPRPASEHADTRRVRMRDRDGAVVREDQAWVYQLSHLPGGLLMWPRAPEGVRSVEIEGFAPLELAAPSASN